MCAEAKDFGPLNADQMAALEELAAATDGDSVLFDQDEVDVFGSGPVTEPLEELGAPTKAPIVVVAFEAEDAKTAEEFAQAYHAMRENARWPGVKVVGILTDAAGITTTVTYG